MTLLIVLLAIAVLGALAGALGWLREKREDKDFRSRWTNHDKRN